MSLRGGTILNHDASVTKQSAKFPSIQDTKFYRNFRKNIAIDFTDCFIVPSINEHYFGEEKSQVK